MATPVEEDLAPDTGPSAAPVDDHDLDFLKPGFRRPKADEDLSPDAPAPTGPEDRLGKANREYQENVAALKAPPAAQQKVLPTTSAGGAVAAGLEQGASLGWGDELAAHADSLISKVPGLRDVREAGANKLFGHPLGALPYNDPNLTYEQRRDAYRDYNEGAKAQHGKLFTAGEIGGGVATAFAPGMSLGTAAEEVGGRILPAIAPTVAEVAGQGALLGTVAGAGESNASTPGGVVGDALESGAIGGAGGALLHTVGSKVVAPLAEKAVSKIAGKAATLADKQAVAQLAREAPKSLTGPMTADPNLSAAINEPIQVANGKAVTLNEMAGKSAEQVRPVLKAGQEKVDQKLGELFNKSDAATSGKAGMTVMGAGQKRGGGADLADIVGHYDDKIAEAAKMPGNEKQISALEGARQDAIEHWGPQEAEIQAKHGELGKQTDAIYDKGDQKSGGVTVGDLIQHRANQIAELKKSPGNEAAIGALEAAQKDEMKWGAKTVTTLDPHTAADVDALQKVRANIKDPGTIKQIDDQIQALSAKGKQTVTFDPTVKVPSKAVRAYATKLQSEGATNVADPKLAAQARKMLGSSTKDFVNGHVESVLGPKDRQALEALNKRTSNLYKWPDVVSGKETNPAIRDAVLDEFGTKVPTKDINDFAGKLEERGTQRIDKLSPGEASLAKENLGKVTRDFANEHAAKTLSPEDRAEFDRLIAHRASLKNIDKVLERREIGEKGNKIGLGTIAAHAVATAPGLTEIGHGVSKVLTGDIGGGLAHVGSGVALTAAPFVAKNARAIGRSAVRGVASGADYLANVAASAEAGNPWARRMMDTLRQTPGGAARLAAALARMRGAAGSAAEQ